MGLILLENAQTDERHPEDHPGHHRNVLFCSTAQRLKDTGTKSQKTEAKMAEMEKEGRRIKILSNC